MKDNHKKNNIKIIFRSIDCASSNGLNERLNQTLVNRIRCKFNSGDTRAWSEITNDCVEEYNTTVQSVTKFSPNYLLYGQESEIVPNELVNNRELFKDIKEAFLNLTKHFGSNKSRIDKNGKDYKFKENDLVFVNNGSKLNRDKLNEIRLGPLRVIRRVSNFMYEVDCGKKKTEAN